MLYGDMDLDTQFSQVNMQFWFFVLVYAWGPGYECSQVALTFVVLPSFKWRAEIVAGIPAPDKPCCQTAFNLSHLFKSISSFLDPECVSLWVIKLLMSVCTQFINAELFLNYMPVLTMGFVLRCVMFCPLVYMSILVKVINPFLKLKCRDKVS